MDLGRLDLNLLRLVEAVLSEGSVSRAARRLRLSQPAVSQGLKRARDMLGDPLLARHGNRLIPTPRGLALAPELRAILQRIEGILAPAAFRPATATREFIIASADLGQVLVLPGMIARITREAPGCRVKIVPPPPDFGAADQLDLLVMGAPVAGGPVDWRPLFEDHFVMIARHGHPALEESLSATDFARLPQALVSPRGQGYEGPVDLALARIGLERHVAIMLTSFLSLPAILQASGLVAAVPGRFADLPAVRSACGRRPLPFEVPPYVMKLVWHRARSGDPALAWLCGEQEPCPVPS